MSSKKPIVLNTTRDLLSEIDKNFSSKKCLFRGQHYDYPLLPKFARKASERSIVDPVALEKRMLETFKRQSIPYLKNTVPNNDWDWLALAQHYGLPTRLLDWSSNAFIALWFAVHNRKLQIKSDAILWVLKTKISDYAPVDKQKNVFEIGRTYIFQPSHLTNRIVAQSGWFTVHRYKEGHLPFVSLEKNKAYKNRLTKYLISNKNLVIIERELKSLGITEKSLFPGLESICREIEKDNFK